MDYLVMQGDSVVHLDEASFAPSSGGSPRVFARRFSFLELMDLFTEAEQTALVNSSNTAVRLFLLMAAGASYVTMDDPRTGAALDALQALGLITGPRKARILEGLPPA